MLTGKRIIITRAEEQASELIERLRALAAEPHVCSTIAFAPPTNTAPLDAALAALAHFDWLVVASANAVRFTFERMAALQIDPAPLYSLSIGAVGPTTAQELRKHGFPPTFVATTARAKGFVQEIGDLRGMRVLLPSADIARAELADGLRAKGATVDVATAYQTVAGEGVEQIAGLLANNAVDAITFASPSAVRYTMAGLTSAAIEQLGRVAIVCIGPTTAAAARDAGLHVSATAAEPTTKGILAALERAV